MIKWGWEPDLGQVKMAINRRMIRIAKSNNGGDPKTTSEQAAEMAKDILLAMGDKLSYPDNYGYYFQKLFNQLYRAISFDEKKGKKTRVEG